MTMLIEKPMDTMEYLYRHDEAQCVVTQTPFSTTLFHAVALCQRRKLRLLLKCGTGVHSKNSHGEGLLVAALRMEDSDKRFTMFRQLLRHGANPLDKDWTTGRNILMWACAWNRPVEVKLLLNHVLGDINLAETDNEGETALHHATYSDSVELVRILIQFLRKYYISPDVANKEGLTPYLLARRLGFTDVAQVLRHEGKACTQFRDSHSFKSAEDWEEVGRKERQKLEVHRLAKKINFEKMLGQSPRSNPIRGSKQTVGFKLPALILDKNSVSVSAGANCSSNIVKSQLMSRSNPNMDSHDKFSKQSHADNPMESFLNLLDMTSSKGHVVTEFHKSQLDPEPRVPNPINDMFAVLADQCSSSFRNVARPPKIIGKPKEIKREWKKVSTLAILFGKAIDQRKGKSKKSGKRDSKTKIKQSLKDRIESSKAKSIPKPKSSRKVEKPKPVLFADAPEELRESSLIRSQYPTLPPIDQQN